MAAPPPANSAVRRLAPMPFLLLTSTSAVSTRYSLPLMLMENRSKTNSGLCTAPPVVMSRTTSFAGVPAGMAMLPETSETSSLTVAE